MKNQSKIEAQDGSPLGIGFWRILVGFGSQVGVENRAKSDQESITKRIEKIMKKRYVFKAPGWGIRWTGHCEAGILGPPNF